MSALFTEFMYPYINIFGNPFPSYGLFIGLGVVVSLLTAVLVTRRKYTFDFVDYVFFLLWLCISGILGAKLLYIIVELDTMIAHPEMWLMYLRGGGVFYGGLIGGLTGAFIASRKKGWNYLSCLDTCAAPICFAHALGRVGCFLGGCCYGAVCESPLSVVYPEGSAAPANVPILPVQLFESAFLVILGISLMIVLKHTKRIAFTSALYMMAYGAWRFFIEFLRADDRGAVGTLSTSQFISVFIVVLGILLLVFRKKAVQLFEPKKRSA